MRHRITRKMTQIYTLAHGVAHRYLGLIIRRSQVQILQGPYIVAARVEKRPPQKVQTVDSAGTVSNSRSSSIVVNHRSYRTSLLPRSVCPTRSVVDGVAGPVMNVPWGLR
jgi:hypothetical protein